MNKAAMGAVLALSLVLSAGAALAQDPGTGPATAEAAASADASTQKASSLDVAAKQAGEVAVSSGLSAAVGAVWKLAWEGTWPFLKSVAVKFWGLIVQAASVFTRTDAPAANVNATAVNAAAGTGASVNAP